MQISDIILEKHYTGPLSHATSISIAKRIADTGKVLLSYAGDPGYNASIESKTLQRKSKENKYKYYLSTSRNKLNDYRQTQYGLYATLILDSNFFKNNPNYIVEPVDYFYYSGGSGRNIDMDWFNDRRRGEAEERIWGKVDHAPLECISELHTFVLYGNSIATIEELMGTYKKFSEANIKTYYYDNLKFYMHLIKREARGTKLEVNPSGDIRIV